MTKIKILIYVLLVIAVTLFFGYHFGFLELDVAYNRMYGAMIGIWVYCQWDWMKFF